MTAQMGNETESSDLDFSAIQSLSQELGLPPEEINRHYQNSLSRLRAGARIKSFLPILASSEVREFVLKMRLRSPA